MESPKELTPTLLGLVFDCKVTIIYDINTKTEYKIDNQYICFDANIGYKAINIDTLTRLMKEWCYKQGYKIGVTNHSVELYTFKEWKPFTSLKFRTTDDVNKDCDWFPMILKATNWVAKEKGLL